MFDMKIGWFKLVACQNSQFLDFILDQQFQENVEKKRKKFFETNKK